jgi:hypothetical protein
MLGMKEYGVTKRGACRVSTQLKAQFGEMGLVSSLITCKTDHVNNQIVRRTNTDKHSAQYNDMNTYGELCPGVELHS